MSPAERDLRLAGLDDGDAKATGSGPWEDRTPDQRIKSPLLYLTELTAHIYSAYLSNTIGIMCQKFFRLE